MRRTPIWSLETMSAASFRQCASKSSSVMRRWAMNFVPFLFHPINSITAYKGQIEYDTPETEAKSQTPVPYLKWMPAPGVTPPNPDDVAALFLPPPVPGQLGKAPGPTGPPIGPGPAWQPQAGGGGR